MQIRILNSQQNPSFGITVNMKTKNKKLAETLAGGFFDRLVEFKYSPLDRSDGFFGGSITNGPATPTPHKEIEVVDLQDLARQLKELGEKATT